MSRSFRRIGVVAGATMTSRVLGLARDILTTAFFGATALNSAFVTAFSLPNLFRRLLGEGSLTAALIPTLHDEQEQNGRDGAHALLNKVVSWLLLATLLLTGAAVLVFSQAEFFFGLWRSWFPQAQIAGRWILGAELAMLLFPYVIFVCLAAAFGAALNLFGRFAEPALSPIWLNLAMIAALGGPGVLLAETAEQRMYYLCIGVLAGGFLQMVIPGWVLFRRGWRPALDLTLSPRIREVARLMAPGLFGVAIYQINILVSRLLAFQLDDSAASLLFYANRIMELPIGVFTIAVTTVIFPLITGHAARRDYPRLAEAHRKGMSLVLVVNIPAAVGIILLAEPIIGLLFQRGQWTAEHTRAMAPVLAVFAVGLPFFSFVTQTTRAFYALKDTATPVRIAGLSFLLNLILSLALMRPFGVIGLAIASNATVAVQAFLLQRLLAARVPAIGRFIIGRTLGKIAAGTMLMAGLVAGGRALIEAAAPASWAEAATVLLLVPAGALVYALLLWILRIEGREELVAALRREPKAVVSHR